MKRIFSLLIVIATSLSLSNYSHAQDVKVKSGSLTGAQSCVPYTTPVTSSAVACGTGFTGMKYYTTTQTCPDRKVTVSKEYDVSNCVPVKPQTGPRCDLNPDACAGSPVAKPCPQPNMHWTLAGTGIAHCVKDDFACPVGSKLVRDAYGEASCQAIVCPGNQIVQSDGSCACPSGLPIWNGSVCQAAVCSNYTVIKDYSCPAGETGINRQEDTMDCHGNFLYTRNVGYTCSPATCSSTTTAEYRQCGFGQSGTMSRYRYVLCPNNAVSYSEWDMSNCSSGNPVETCTPNSYTDTAPCGNGLSGNKTRSVSLTCPGNVTKYGEWDTSSCSASCTTSTVKERDDCPAGYYGYRYRMVTNLCPSGANYGEWDNSACIYIDLKPKPNNPTCQNGATDYPTCTPPKLCLPKYYDGTTYWVYGWGQGSDSSTPGNSPYNQVTGLYGWNSCTPTPQDLADWNNK